MQLIFTLRSHGVTDQRVLTAFEKIPRQLFVDESFTDRAYADSALPIDCGQTISQPAVVGIMLQALEITQRCKVLEVGAGSGYVAALLALLARRVYAIERHRSLTIAARDRVAQLDLANVSIRTGDGTRGWPEQAPFDRIVISAAAEDPPSMLLEQLRPGGIMVLPVGQSDDVQQLIRIERTDYGLAYRELSAVRFVPLMAGIPEESPGSGGG